jgi:uncharacterized membrane protein YeaQ/YmgE (transglycosylase-associated protein family)
MQDTRSRGRDSLTIFALIFNSVWDIVLLLVVAALCGLIAQAVARHHRGGCLEAMGIGFIGPCWASGWHESRTYRIGSRSKWAAQAS